MKKEIKIQKRTYASVKYNIDLLKSMKADYTLEHSNYTTTIIYANGDKLKFLKNKMNTQTFGVFNTIKKDIRVLNLDMDDIFRMFTLERQNIYYNSLPSVEDIHDNIIINYDIKAAYPNALKNLGFITSDTLKKIMELKKGDRLASIGMLASKKTITTYKGGEPQRLDFKTGEFRNVFILLVRYIDDLMLQVSKIAGKYFIFFWVDGFYLRPDTPQEIIDKIEWLFVTECLDLHRDTLQNFNLKRRNGKIKINFKKEGKIKKFNFKDKNRYTELNIFINLLNKKIKTNV